MCTTGEIIKLMAVQTKKDRSVRYKFKEPSMYNVILHNDDETTMDFVVYILNTIFRKPMLEAEALMLKVDREGSAVAGTYYKDIAESKCEKAIAEARQNGFPLMLTVEEVK